MWRTPNREEPGKEGDRMSIPDPVREPGTPKPPNREPPDAPPPQEDQPSEEPPRKDLDDENKPIKVEVSP